MFDSLLDRFDFLMNGSMFATGALWILSGTAILWVITRWREWLLLFAVTALYLLPFLLQ